MSTRKTDAELDQYILANYPQKSQKQMVSECRVNHNRIRQRIRALGIEDKTAERELRAQDMRDKWAQKHAEYIGTIERMAPTHSWTEIAQVLGVKRSRISNYASRKGLKHTRETYEALHRKAMRAFISAPWTDERRRGISESRKAAYRKEELRIRWGLPQKTNLRVGRTPVRLQQIRSYLSTYGYFGFRDEPHTIYYDEQTDRCPVQYAWRGRQTEEYFAKTYGLVFKAADGYEDEIREAVV